MDRDFARTPWEPEPIDEDKLPRRGWKRALVILVLAFVLGPVVLFGSRILLSKSVSGTVTFSSRAADCATNLGVSAFTAGTPVYATVVLERGVSPGEAFTVRLLRNDAVLSTWDYVVSGAGNCASEAIDSGTLARGHYRVTYTVGDEVLAAGEFDVN